MNFHGWRIFFFRKIASVRVESQRAGGRAGGQETLSVCSRCLRRTRKIRKQEKKIIEWRHVKRRRLLLVRLAGPSDPGRTDSCARCELIIQHRVPPTLRIDPRQITKTLSNICGNVRGSWRMNTGVSECAERGGGIVHDPKSQAIVCESARDCDATGRRAIFFTLARLLK